MKHEYLEKLTSDLISMDYDEFISVYQSDHLASDILDIITSLVSNIEYNHSMYLRKCYTILSRVLISSIYSSSIKDKIDNITHILNDKLKDEDFCNDMMPYPKLKRLLCLNLGLKVAMSFNLLKYYDGDTYKMMDYLINKRKDLSLIKDVLNMSPSISNTCDKNHNPLIYNIISKYLDELYSYMEGYHSSYLYYDNVIKMILGSNLDLKDNMKSKILKCISSYNNLSYDNFKRNSTYFEDELSKIYDQIKDYNNQFSFTSLVDKYHINYHFSPILLSDISLGNGLEYKLIDDLIVTIDGCDTTNYDDALSIKKSWE